MFNFTTRHQFRTTARKYKEVGYVCMLLNLLTIPFSPVINESVSREAYAPITNIKFAIVAALVIYGLLLGVAWLKFLNGTKKVA